jgi:hypothetical protein
MLMLCGCAEKEQHIAGDGPVERFTKKAHWISVYGRSGVTTDDLCAVRFVAPFEPGHSFPEAERLYGPPDDATPEERGKLYLIYETTNGIVKLGSETTSDGHTYHPIYFIPHDRRPSAFFCAAIVKQIDPHAPKQVVMVIKFGERYPFLHAVIEYGQVKHVIQGED